MTKLWSSSAYINNQAETRRKMWLPSEQVDAMERSFQEDIELEQQPGARIYTLQCRITINLNNP